jgi:hypothetical protein
MITAKEAVYKGHKTVTFPSLLILFFLMGVCFYLNLHNIIPNIMLLPEFALSLFLCWLYRSLMISKWVTWAFENVEDLVELEHRAIKGMLL